MYAYPEDTALMASWGALNHPQSYSQDVVVTHIGVFKQDSTTRHAFILHLLNSLVHVDSLIAELH